MRRVRLIFAALLLSCVPRRAAKVPALPHDVTVYVAVSDQVAKTDTGNVAAMVDAIDSELRENGYSVSIVAARSDERPPVPRLELQVMSSDSGNAELRGAGNLAGMLGGGVGVMGAGAAIAGGGSMQVDVYMVSGGGRAPLYVGRYKASSFGAASDEAVAAGERVGGAIASDVSD